MEFKMSINQASIVILLSLLINGCAFNRNMDVHITGKNIKSVYANGDADIHYKSHTEVSIWK